VVVIGAGPAGLAASAALNRAGIRARVLDRAHCVGSSWRGYYEGLRLNSPRRLSSLPGSPIDRGCGRWPSRDDVIVYLERYARKHCPPIDLGVEVHRVERTGAGWRVETSEGPFEAAALVIATGLNASPTLPEWFDRERFEGELLHSMEYENAKPYTGREVLVVGSGMSGTDIALELLAARARRVWMSVRTPPIIFRPQILGVPASFLGYLVKRLPPRIYPLLDPGSLVFHKVLYGDLSSYGLGAPPEGMLTAMSTRNHGVTVDRGLVAAVKSGEIEIVPAVEGLEGGDVLLAGGGRLRPDAVIAATGQAPGLQGLVGHLGVLGRDGRPLVHGGRTARRAPDMYFLGYRLPPGQLPDMARDARAIARKISRRLKQERPVGARTK
jgi:putative flavoprotein involved in K+ transport